ncbi:MAG: ATP-binding cassette domain-containing protein [Terrimesophilobacter sp.]
MIRFDDVTFTYPGATSPVLKRVDLQIEEGELCLVVGPTGSGKTTLLQLVDGLAPHFTGGLLQGAVTVAGRDTRDNPPRELAEIVGVVTQNPVAGFVTDTVDEELAYGMEQLAVPGAVMRKRVEEVVDLLGLGSLRGRPLIALSAGEQQRVAIGAVLTSHPRVLVLDEPTSALDPPAAEEVLAAITRLVDDIGITVILAEHRLERVAQYADSTIRIGADGSATHGPTRGQLSSSRLAPPVVELGSLMGWDPLPLSVRDARRLAAPLRRRLQAVRTPEVPEPSHDILLRARGIAVKYGHTTALAATDTTLHAGEVVGLMGRNGAGKTSLLWALQGSGRRSGGTVSIQVPAQAIASRRRSAKELSRCDGPVAIDPAALRPDLVRQFIALVPQNPADLLYRETVEAECADSDQLTASVPGTTAAILQELTPGIPPSRHPRDLSEGQCLALVLAIQLAAAPRILLLDEPTRGLDYESKRRLTRLIAAHATSGGCVLLSSHDVEFVAGVADRVIVLASGEAIVDGPAIAVLTASPSFSPQVAKVLHPLPLLTVEAVRRALKGEE